MPGAVSFDGAVGPGGGRRGGCGLPRRRPAVDLGQEARPDAPVLTLSAALTQATAGRPGFCRGGASTEIPGAGRRSRSGRAQARGDGFFSHRRASRAGAPAQRNAGLGAQRKSCLSRSRASARVRGRRAGSPAAFIGRFGRQSTDFIDAGRELDRTRRPAAWREAASFEPCET